MLRKSRLTCRAHVRIFLKINKILIYYFFFKLINKNFIKNIFLVCGKIFTSLPGLKGHERRHVEGPPKKYFCDLCGNRFGERTLIQTHMKFTHIQKRKFYCPQCPERSWLNRRIRDAHIKTNHEGVKYPCHLCGREYMSRQQLKFHLDYHNSYLYDPNSRRSQLRPEKEYQRNREYKIRMKMQKKLK